MVYVGGGVLLGGSWSGSCGCRIMLGGMWVMGLCMFGVLLMGLGVGRVEGKRLGMGSMG